MASVQGHIGSMKMFIYPATNQSRKRELWQSIWKAIAYDQELTDKWIALEGITTWEINRLFEMFRDAR